MGEIEIHFKKFNYLMGSNCAENGKQVRRKWEASGKFLRSFGKQVRSHFRGVY
jgi:hypothetical protein